MEVISALALNSATGLFLTYNRMLSAVNQWDVALADMEHIGKVTVLMPTLNEAATIQNTLATLRNQNILTVYPEYFEFVVADSSSEDGTAELAAAYVDRVITVSKGKLNAIDEAISQLDSEIIVAVDGDSSYGVNFLNLLLTHFEDPEVVAVSGVELQDKVNLFFFSMLISEQYLGRIIPRLMGRGAAYTRAGYYATGGFDLSINQKDVWAMMNEEEWGFYKRLSQIGKVIRDYQAAVVTTDRRTLCSPESPDPYCQQVVNKERF